MKKKILAFTLAVLLICTMAVPASAAQYTYFGEYKQDFQEVVDTCNEYDFSCTTIGTSSEYTVKADVDFYVWIDGTATTSSHEIKYGTIYGDANPAHSTTAASFDFELE